MLRQTAPLLPLLSALCPGCLVVRIPGSVAPDPGPPSDHAATVAALRADVDHLAGAIGVRAGPSLPQVVAWIEGRFQAMGLDPRRDTYLARGTEYHNVMADVTGQTPEIVVVGAHYDTVPTTPGADDNASGVAVLLALADTFAGTSPQRTLRFEAYANEEPPFFQTDDMGSRVAARRARERGDPVVAMVCLESLGVFSDAPGSQELPFPLRAFYPSEGNFLLLVSNRASRDLLHQVVAPVRAAGRLPVEVGAAPPLIPGVGWSDHWSWWKAGYPAVMVTDTAVFRNRCYHEPCDTPDTLDYERMARVVEVLEPTLALLAGGAVPAPAVPAPAIPPPAAPPTAALRLVGEAGALNGQVFLGAGDLLVGDPTVPGRPGYRPLAGPEPISLPEDLTAYEILGGTCDREGTWQVDDLPLAPPPAGRRQVLRAGGDLDGDGRDELVVLEAGPPTTPPPLELPDLYLALYDGGRRAGEVAMQAAALPCALRVADAGGGPEPEVVVAWRSPGGSGFTAGVSAYRLEGVSGSR